MANDGLLYLLRRASEERLRADGSRNATAKASHAGIADEYERHLTAGSQEKLIPIRREVGDQDPGAKSRERRSPAVVMIKSLSHGVE